MRKMSLALTLASLTLTALAVDAAFAGDRNPFVGRWRWDGPKTCPANYQRENVALDIQEKAINFYDPGCRINSIQALDAGARRFDVTCTGDEGTERSRIVFALLQKSKINDELLLRIEPESGYAFAYRRCP